MNRHVTLTLAAALVAYLTVPAAALATPIFSSDILVQVTDANVGPGASQQIVSGNLWNVDIIPLTTVSHAKAEASAYVQDGLLGAFAWAQSLPEDTNFVAAAARAASWDTLTLESNSLPFGTPVSMLLTLDLDVELSSTQTPSMGGGCGSTGQGILSVYGSSGALLATLQDVQSPSPCETLIAVPTVVTANIGDELLAILTLNVMAGGRIGGGSSADALHTLRFFADPLSDFYYETASGNNYLSTPTAAVPEPTSLLLFGSGIAGVAANVRRRRKGHPSSSSYFSAQ